jgi:hypothetical protein
MQKQRANNYFLNTGKLDIRSLPLAMTVKHSSHSDAEVMFLSPNTTSLVQDMDQGVMKACVLLSEEG